MGGRLPIQWPRLAVQLHQHVVGVIENMSYLPCPHLLGDQLPGPVVVQGRAGIYVEYGQGRA